jgi:hypothetical protein
MATNGKWDFLVPVAMAAASLLSATPSTSNVDHSAATQKFASDDLVLQAPLLASQVRHLDHESHSSHSSHRSHRSHQSSH